MCSFYALRSQKCQMTLLTWLSFYAHSGSTSVKAVHRTLVKLTPGVDFTNILCVPNWAQLDKFDRRVGDLLWSHKLMITSFLRSRHVKFLHKTGGFGFQHILTHRKGRLKVRAPDDFQEPLKYGLVESLFNMLTITFPEWYKVIIIFF